MNCPCSYIFAIMYLILFVVIHSDETSSGGGGVTEKGPSNIMWVYKKISGDIYRSFIAIRECRYIGR